MPKIERLTCLAYDGNPNNVRMASALQPIVTTMPVSGRVFLINAPRTVPVPANVLQGVKYGNDGIEFTGSYSLGAAVYPIENDVRDGVDYGPTGADFDGDLVLPAEADVKLGVDYGADGTEFEGEYAGGGGNTYSRGRVVAGQ